MTEPSFLTLEEVMRIHRESLRRFGGADGVRDANALESAIAAPQASFGGTYLHAFPFGMAAAYAFHIAQAQAFIDGNKRTGAGAALLFLGLQGRRVRDPERRLAEMILAFATQSTTIEECAQLLEALSVPLS